VATVIERYAAFRMSEHDSGMAIWIMPAYANPERSAACVPIEMQFLE
jgi:hypothetical protein